MLTKPEREPPEPRLVLVRGVVGHARNGGGAAVLAAGEEPGGVGKHRVLDDDGPLGQGEPEPGQGAVPAGDRRAEAQKQQEADPVQQECS